MAARGLVVAGTASDVGKSVITAGICRWLHRQGVRVAPFKAQNMSNNSVVVLDSPVSGSSAIKAGEIGRAQALQAAACGLAPSARFNPILLKPGSDQTSQLIVLGQAVGEINASNFRSMQRRVRQIAFDTLAQLQAEFDVVICEGAGSLAEINLRAGDFVNMGLARQTNWPVLAVADIDRGGVFGSLYGSLALLSADDQRLIAGYIINKFRGDAGVLRPGLRQLEKLTGRPVYGVLPWQLELWLDSEDSLPGAVLGQPTAPLGSQGLRVAVVRLPRISNATDFDALAAEPGVQVSFTVDAGELAAADLIILPGTKATVTDLHWLRKTGLAEVIVEEARAGRPLLGICGGFQMLARRIYDTVESKEGTVDGLGLLPIEIKFAADKILAQSQGTVFDDTPIQGYEIHHGYVANSPASLEPLIVQTDDTQEGARQEAIFGTHWHGIFESNQFRRRFLTEVAQLVNRRGFVVAPDTDYGQIRERMIDVLGDLIEQHIDTASLLQLINSGAPANLPVITARLA